MKQPKHLRAALALGLFSFIAAAAAAETNSATDQEAAYTRTLDQRADKIVTTLGIEDVAKSNRVHSIIVQEYRDSGQIHVARDTEVQAAKARTNTDKATNDKFIQASRDYAKWKLDKLHAEFIAKLSSELSPEQVDKVKDGMTYSVVQVTFNAYTEIYLDLTDAQKKQIMDWLIEAREIAMDQGTSNEKHAVFGKYKGKINNYLSKAGYDAKKGEANLKKASQPPSDSKPK